MKWTAVWSKNAQKELDKLPKEDVKRIVLKTRDVEENPFSYLARMTNSPYHKFRVGSYRVIVDVLGDKLILYVELIP